AYAGGDILIAAIRSIGSNRSLPPKRNIYVGRKCTLLQCTRLQVADIHHTFSPVGGHTVNIVIFSPGGAHVQSGSNDRTIKLWDAATGALIRTFEGHSSSRIGRIFPDGARALSGSFDQTLKLWDTATRALIRTIEGESQGVGHLCGLFARRRASALGQQRQSTRALGRNYGSADP